MNKQASDNVSHFLYFKLADDVEGNIKNGNFRIGEKLPSLRNLHTRTGLSISTVYQAYIELEKRGLVEAKEKSGFFVKHNPGTALRLPGFKKSLMKPRKPTVNTLADTIHKAIGKGDMLPLGAALPSPELLPVKQLTSSKQKYYLLKLDLLLQLLGHPFKFKNNFKR